MRKSKMTLKFLVKVMGLFLFTTCGFSAKINKCTTIKTIKNGFCICVIRGWKYSAGFFLGGGEL